jgi:CubicO group peptidase (beta-lactamase class C family)
MGLNRVHSKKVFLSRLLIAALVFSLTILPSAQIAQMQEALPLAKPEKVGMSSERLQRLSRRMQDYIDKGQVAGVVTLVARQGKIVHYEAQGYRNREQKIPMQKDDLFVIMSMTKPIVSTALMMLYEEGKFLLNDPISKYLPEFEKMQVKVVDEKGESKLVPARPITVRHILTHTAGLATPTPPPAPPAGTTPRPVDESGAPQQPPRPTTIRERVKQIAARPLNFQPGDKWEYGSATDVVAALAEVISGKNMDDFLRERIFKPLGMNDTHYNVPESKWSRRASVYVPEPDGSIKPMPMPTPRPTTIFGGVAGLSSTPSDYFKFAQMVLNGGELNGVRLLSPKTIDFMISNHIGDLPVNLKGPGYGFGLGYSVLMDSGKASESLSPGSFGWGGAWGTYYFVDPVEELIGIIMIQITSYRHLNIRQDLGTLAEQAIIEPKSSGGQKIRGYERIQ